MEIRKVVEREFTKEEQYTIENVGKYMWGTMALIGNNSGIIFLEADNAKFTDEELISRAKNYMEDIISTHPDFESYDMKDGACLILMESGFAFSEPDMPATIGTKLMTRGQLLEACEKGEIIAIVEIRKGEM